ncbi:MAG: hypothetical protein ACI8ZM_000120 [Crocinitomix sp.]|jgi:hypothetical protein
MKKLRRFQYCAMIFSCVLVCSCNWLENKKERAEDGIIEEFEDMKEQVEDKIIEGLVQHVLEPITPSFEEIFSYDSAAAAESCTELRPNPIRPASLQDIHETGYQYSVLANTPDSVLPHIDGSFFEATDKFFPLTFPYFIENSGGKFNDFRLKTGYCQFSDLPSQNGKNYNQISHLAIYDQYLMIITYDSFQSMMSVTPLGIVYYIINLNHGEYFEYSKQEGFDLARHKLTNSNDSLMSPSDFIRWYEKYSSP